MDGLASAGSFVPVGGRRAAGWLDGDCCVTGTGLFTKMELLILVKGDKNCGSGVSGQMISLHFA